MEQEFQVGVFFLVSLILSHLTLLIHLTAVRVRLVDFAHTYPNAEGDSTLDTNFLSALNILVNLWESISICGRELYENQRLKAGVWSKDNLVKGDPHYYSDAQGKMAVHMADPSQWVIDKKGGGVGEDGWVYSTNFKGGGTWSGWGVLGRVFFFTFFF